MAFDATIGGADANSYCEVAFADDYFTTRLNSEWWGLLSPTEKQAYLVTSTLALETYVDWKGAPESDEQALHFPADGVDCKGNDFPDAEIPLAVQRAVCEQASFYNGLDATELPVALLQGIASAKVGSLQVKFDKANVSGRLGETAQGFVSCYGTLKSGARGGHHTGSVLINRI